MIKRLFDIIVSFTGIVIAVPLMIILGLIIAFKLGRPVFFKQQRPGLNEKPFNMIKLRTMTYDVDEDGDLLPNEKRITPFGKFLRSSSLDELPELFNVLQGDMSLVGPRPLLMDYLPYFSEEHHRRHHVKPGITGWAQINGRNTISWDEKLALDLWYVENRSFLLDLKILYLTLFRVVKREGITPPNYAATQRFDEYMNQKKREYESSS